MTFAIVFFEGKFLIELESEKALNTWRRSVHVGYPEYYNKSYIYCPDWFRFDWGRVDGTPVLRQDIPKELRTTVLLMTRQRK